MDNAKNNVLPFPVIVLATSGDVDAINAVLKHYEGYIAVLSTKQLYDESGNPHLCVDEGLKRRLETKLITAILSFTLTRRNKNPSGKRVPLSTLSRLWVIRFITRQKSILTMNFCGLIKAHSP
jgi:hypothetical protein